VIISVNKEELKEIMARLSSISEEYGLELNKQKSKTMIEDNLSNNQTVARYQVVSMFKIRRRMEMARNATTKLTKIWRARTITQNTKLRIANSLIFPIMVWLRTWTLKEGNKQRIRALQMWIY